MEDPLQGAGEFVQHLGHRGSLAGGGAAGGGAGAAKVMLHVLAHGLGLARHHLGQRAGCGLRLRQHDRDGRLQRMGEVADMGPLTLDHLLVVVQEGVQFAGEGLDFGRIVA